ncbi:MAG: archaellin/type IV pilin N-terminal domain-containing protein, partial [Candidatus Aenigmatarchaeota archaeon]
MKKGISPLVAAVILIAFVVAIAGIASAFFTDITEEWTGGVEEESPVECGLMSLEILGLNTDKDTVTYWSPDTEIVKGVSATVYNENDTTVETARNNASLDSGESGELSLNTSLESDYTVELTSLDCPDITTEE